MAKIFTKAQTLLDGLKKDVLWVLITIYAHRERAKLPSLATMSREAFVLELILLESASRDIVARLTALDDREKGTRTFESALAALNREGLPPKRSKALDQAVKAFRATVNSLKLDHRNRYIAHVQELSSVEPRVLSHNPPLYEESASRAVNLLDLLVGQAVPYELHIGSMERAIDLRAALSAP